jgi:hypothetical protein
MLLATGASKGKSAITNRPTRLDGVDGRSAEGRRRRDLIEGYVAALGGPEKVTAAAMLDVKRAAELVQIAERKRADALRGADIDLGQLIRLEGAVDRAVRRLGIGPGTETEQPPTEELFAVDEEACAE